MATRTQFAARPHVEYSWSVPTEDPRSEEKMRFKTAELSTRIVNPYEAASQKAPRRDRVQILLKMLQSASVSIRKTHLMYGAGINFYQLEKHLAFLLASGMVEEIRREDDAVEYRTTEKGRLFSELFA